MDRNLAVELQVVEPMEFCFHCGTKITDTRKAVAVIVIESHSGKLGSARLHSSCCEQSLARYKQAVQWDGATVGNLNALKRLHGRIAAMNDAR